MSLWGELGLRMPDTALHAGLFLFRGPDLRPLHDGQFLRRAGALPEGQRVHNGDAQAQQHRRPAPHGASRPQDGGGKASRVVHAGYSPHTASAFPWLARTSGVQRAEEALQEGLSTPPG